jgi:hypothetical protein
MTTIDTIADTVCEWLATHHKRPEHPIVIADGQYADGTHVAVGYQPDDTLVYRLQRDGVYAFTPCTAAAMNADGTLQFVHRATERHLETLRQRHA